MSSKESEICGVCIYYFAATQQTRTLKLPAYLLIFQTKEHVLRINKSKITAKNSFDGDHFESEGNHESSKDEKSLFWVFLQICDQCFNP